MPTRMIYTFDSEVVPYPGMGGWHFVYLPKEIGQRIKKDRDGKPRIGWGSVPATATIRKTTWKSSIFPDKKSASYVLPLKAEIRKKESIKAHDTVHVTLMV